MEMNIHSILPEEIAAMGGHSNRVLNEKTGCIGYLTANLNASAPEFESSWHDRTPRLNTPEFTDDFNDMIDALRQGILKSPAELRAYCAAHPDSLLQDNPSANTRHGFRINDRKVLLLDGLLISLHRLPLVGKCLFVPFAGSLHEGGQKRHPHFGFAGP